MIWICVKSPYFTNLNCSGRWSLWPAPFPQAPEFLGHLGMMSRENAQWFQSKKKKREVPIHHVPRCPISAWEKCDTKNQWCNWWRAHGSPSPHFFGGSTLWKTNKKRWKDLKIHHRCWENPRLSYVNGVTNGPYSIAMLAMLLYQKSIQILSLGIIRSSGSSRRLEERLLLMMKEHT